MSELEQGILAPPAQDPYLDPETGAWVLTRYADVLAAFRDTRLWPVSSRGEYDVLPRNEDGSVAERGDVRDALSAPKLAEWTRAIEAAARATLDQAPKAPELELLEEFGKPWAMSVALMVTQTNPADRNYLQTLGDRVFTGTAAPRESAERTDAGIAVAEMNAYFQNSKMPMAQATFVGISQSMPRLLVNGWLALFSEPDQVARLRGDPELVPRAAEELLRFGGIIPRLFRRAKVDVDLGFLRVAAGERVTLMIASANRDPEKFSDPFTLDVARRAAGQLALGIGHNSCAGATLIRTANATAIRVLLDTFGDIETIGSVKWRTASGFCWPTAVQVRVRRSRAGAQANFARPVGRSLTTPSA